MKNPEAIDLAKYQKLPFRWTDKAVFDESRNKYLVDGQSEMRNMVSKWGLEATSFQERALARVLMRYYHAAWFTDQLILPKSAIPIHFTFDISSEVANSAEKAATTIQFKPTAYEVTHPHGADVLPSVSDIESFTVQLNVSRMLTSIKSYDRHFKDDQSDEFKMEIFDDLVGIPAEGTGVHEISHVLFFLRQFGNRELWDRYDREMERINDPLLSNDEQMRAYFSSLTERNARRWQYSFISHYYPDSIEMGNQILKREEIAQLLAA